MRNTRDTKGGAREPRRSGGAGLVAVPIVVELAVESQGAGMPDERRAQQHTSANRLVSPLYRLLLYDEGAAGASGAEARDDPTGWEQELPFAIPDIITVEEVADGLHVRRDWLIRKAKTRKYPFLKRMSRKKYCCSRILLRRWLASGAEL